MASEDGNKTSLTPGDFMRKKPMSYSGKTTTELIWDLQYNCKEYDILWGIDDTIFNCVTVTFRGILSEEVKDRVFKEIRVIYAKQQPWRNVMRKDQ